ncbi:multicopper oxidase family protein [Brevundimonas aurifodinae]|uniref:Multicopper oxidase domain-containing protein n=1 Tax=Brevundimonas aurifodinae TaxID=1508312 RepID=A0ABV1NK57_9CAUL
MNRRRLLEGTLLGASALVLATPRPLWAKGLTARSAAAPTRLQISRRTLDINGRAATVFGLQQPDGKRGLTLREGEAFNVVLGNDTDESTIVHWHGLTPPFASDGVADASLPLMAPRSERSFDFPVGAAGTHWMHAHTLQEQSLLAAPLIVRSLADERRDEQEVVILLHDFSFSSPEEILERLKSRGTPHAMVAEATADRRSSPPINQPGVAPMVAAPTSQGMAIDINDIEYDAYLANDRTLGDPEIIAVERGGRVRLRIINGATATAFTVDLGEIDGELIAVDGHQVQPIAGRRFPVAMGQRIDVRLDLPRDARPFPIMALREGARQRTGVILQPPGATVARLPELSVHNAPVLDLALEGRLSALVPLRTHPAHKTFDMDLTGSMGGYRWDLETATPISVRRGERIEITMLNTTMMAHPMHLHGHHFQVVAIDSQRFSGAMRDTVNIPPQRSVTISFDTTNAGEWAFHCHHLYHMAAGMMTQLSYET